MLADPKKPGNDVVMWTRAKYLNTGMKVYVGSPSMLGPKVWGVSRYGGSPGMRAPRYVGLPDIWGPRLWGVSRFEGSVGFCPTFITRIPIFKGHFKCQTFNDRMLEFQFKCQTVKLQNDQLGWFKMQKSEIATQPQVF